MLEWLRNLIQRFFDWLMPGPPHQDDEILEAVRKTNIILLQTEENNERRHKELLQVLEKLANPDASSVVFSKVRREEIPPSTITKGQK